MQIVSFNNIIFLYFVHLLTRQILTLYKFYKSALQLLRVARPRSVRWKICNGIQVSPDVLFRPTVVVRIKNNNNNNNNNNIIV
jgi:hypothetical protein